MTKCTNCQIRGYSTTLQTEGKEGEPTGNTQVRAFTKAAAIYVDAAKRTNS